MSTSNSAKSKPEASDPWLLTTCGYMRMEMKQLDIEFPTELIELIALFYKIQIESKILSDDECVIFYDMICKQLNVKAIDWKLIWRGGDDGFDFDSFWNKCDGISPSIVIIETENGKEVLGGFTKVGFKKYDEDQYTKDEDAFLYSLRKIDDKFKAKHTPKIYPICKGQEKYALWYTSYYLCCFGSGSGSDIWIERDCNQRGRNNGSAQSSYDMPRGCLTVSSGFHFTVNEMEVFQLNYP